MDTLCFRIKPKLPFSERIRSQPLPPPLTLLPSFLLYSLLPHLPGLVRSLKLPQENPCLRAYSANTPVFSPYSNTTSPERLFCHPAERLPSHRANFPSVSRAAPFLNLKVPSTLRRSFTLQSPHS